MLTYNGIKMSREQFKNLTDLAVEKGLKTVGEFNQFIDENFRKISKNCQAV